MTRPLALTDINLHNYCHYYYLCLLALVISDCRSGLDECYIEHFYCAECEYYYDNVKVTMATRLSNRTQELKAM